MPANMCTLPQGERFPQDWWFPLNDWRHTEDRMSLVLFTDTDQTASLETIDDHSFLDWQRLFFLIGFRILLEDLVDDGQALLKPEMLKSLIHFPQFLLHQQIVSNLKYIKKQWYFPHNNQMIKSTLKTNILLHLVVITTVELAQNLITPPTSKFTLQTQYLPTGSATSVPRIYNPTEITFLFD